MSYGRDPCQDTRCYFNIIIWYAPPWCALPACAVAGYAVCPRTTLSGAHLRRVHVFRCALPASPRLLARTSGVATSSGAHLRRRHVFRVRSFPYVIIYSRSRTARGADLVSRNRVGIMQFYYWNCAITACNSSLIVFFFWFRACLQIFFGSRVRCACK